MGEKASLPTVNAKGFLKNVEGMLEENTHFAAVVVGSGKRGLGKISQWMLNWGHYFDEGQDICIVLKVYPHCLLVKKRNSYRVEKLGNTFTGYYEGQSEDTASFMQYSSH